MIAPSPILICLPSSFISLSPLQNPPSLHEQTHQTQDNELQSILNPLVRSSRENCGFQTLLCPASNNRRLIYQSIIDKQLLVRHPKWPVKSFTLLDSWIEHPPSFCSEGNNCCLSGIVREALSWKFRRRKKSRRSWDVASLVHVWSVEWKNRKVFDGIEIAYVYLTNSLSFLVFLSCTHEAPVCIEDRVSSVENHIML